MTMMLILAGCLLAVPADTSDNADNSPSGDLSPAVRKLVRQLDAPRLADREKAEADLVRLGPAALELLPETNRRTSAETRQRLARVRQKLQEALARQAARPSTVTFHGESALLSEFLAAVEKQTGNKIIDMRQKFGQPQTDPTLKIDLDKVPFWEALDGVLDQAGMTVYPYAMEPAVCVVAKSADNAKRCKRTVYSGPFRIEPVTVVATRNLRVAGGQSLQVKLEVSWEPRLSPISLRQQFAGIKAVDENGRPLAANNVGANDTGGEIDVQIDRDDTTVEMFLPLALPSRDVKKIASLDGTLDVVLPGKVVTFRFDKLTKAKNVEKRIGAATVTLEGARRNGEIWEIAISIRFDKASGALESHRGWIFNNEAYLETPDGKKIEDVGFETTLQTEDQVGLTYLFDLESPPEKMTFIYKTPSAIMSAQFDYQIKNIPLP